MKKTKQQTTDKCPLCYKQKSSFDVHHVIWRADGGTDDPVNLLKICKTCHAIITFGCREDANPLEQKCLFYQLRLHGLNFILKSGVLTGTHSLKKIILAQFETLPADASASEAHLSFLRVGHTIYNSIVEGAK